VHCCEPAFLSLENNSARLLEQGHRRGLGVNRLCLKQSVNGHTRVFVAVQCKAYVCYNDEAFVSRITIHKHSNHAGNAHRSFVVVAAGWAAVHSLRRVLFK
jgi:hypothetical protein